MEKRKPLVRKVIDILAGEANIVLEDAFKYYNSPDAPMFSFFWSLVLSLFLIFLMYLVSLPILIITSFFSLGGKLIRSFKRS